MSAQLRRFRFGIMAERVHTHRDLLETAQAAEAAGYSTLLLRDHFIEPPFGHQLGPIAALATVAAATTTLRIGTLVNCNDYRHPVLLAQEAATLDVVSEGRFELGLGAGFHEQEYASAGIAFDRPGVRVSRLEEALRVVKGLFGDEPCTFLGRHYTVRGLDGFPKPVQRPHPPIHVAGAGPRLLGIAARHADIIGLQGMGAAVERLPDAIDGRLARVRDAAPDAGRLELSTFMTLVVARDRRRAAEDVIRENGWDGVGSDEVLEMPATFIGELGQIEEDLRARRDRYGFSYYVIPRPLMDAAAPIVARMAGT
jgi:probable F420-dependent oxidoreductase